MIKNLAGFVGEDNVKAQVSLNEYTTFRVGGAAEIMVIVNTMEEMAKVIGFLNKCNANYFVLGNGSNLLVSDEGYKGIVIKPSGKLTDMVVVGNKITAGAGALLSNVCKTAADYSLTGMEFAYGIPGTVGGAIVMNAGAYGGDMSMVVDGVEAVTKEGEIIYVSPHSLRFDYRKSDVAKAGIVVAMVSFKLSPGNEEEIRATMKDIMARRVEKQPLEFPSAGSTFKRPKGHFAGQLIEEAGLKGFRIGGACVSPKHAGFIVNDANATAKDISDLIDAVKKKVYDNSGVKLETEVIKIGRF
ncbi:MAG: UDP-N-acetylmuramate dehydrogenase [Lachnospiraceae bacterium]|nr:UDP-N-acetylmuramate dehydrogenase [Lachnospiraceae bacterium]